MHNPPDILTLAYKQILMQDQMVLLQEKEQQTPESVQCTINRDRHHPQRNAPQMHHVSSIPILAGAAAVAIGPVPELGLVLQGAGAGAFVGMIVCYRNGIADSDERWKITTRWSLLGAAGATMALVGAALAALALDWIGG